MWIKRAALALSVFALLVGVLELSARLAMPAFSPVYIRDGLYNNPLPLTSGNAGQPTPLELLPSGGRRLEDEKQPGELRVAVMGESSVAGSPFDVHLSMPAMLLDELRERMPGRNISVINMGRPGSISANVYYYLVYLRRFSPDFVIFYMGINDSPVMSGEQCLLGEHPTLLRAWHGLVESSWLFWLARTYGVQYAWRVTGKNDWSDDESCSVPTFELWTKLLVRFARSLGARVVIANPVYNPLRDLEPDAATTRLEIPAWDEAHKALLACALTAGCDFERAVAAALREPMGEVSFLQRGGLVPSRLFHYRLQLAQRAAAWKHAALDAGAGHLAFEDVLASLSPHEVPPPDFFADGLRLLPHGYLFLARLLAARVAWMVSGQPGPATLPPTMEETRSYLAATAMTGTKNVFEQFRFGMALSVVRGLQFSLRTFSTEPCEKKGWCEELEDAALALAWLRAQAGLDPQAAPRVLERLRDFDPAAVKYRGDAM
jgi:hypothetical protein